MTHGIDYLELFRLFGEACIYLALPILSLALILDLIRDFRRDDSDQFLPVRPDFGVLEPTVPTYLSSRAVDRRKGSRKPR